MRKKGFKPIKRYRLTFVSENTLNTLWTLRLSRARAWLLGALSVAAVGALVALLFGLTPLGAILPGYMRPAQRRSQIENGLRLDSLLELQQVQTAWIENLEAILTDSIVSKSVPPAPDAVTDTLLAASATERKFVDEWTERERFNLSVIAPAATSGISFRDPLSVILRRDTVAGPALLLESTRNATVMAVSGGTVIDSHVDISTGRQVVIMQHPLDFVSRYDGIARSFVAPGQKVQPGAAIGLLGPDARLKLTVYRNGSPLIDFQ